MSKSIMSWIILGFVFASPVFAFTTGSVVLSGRVDPQLSVTTSMDWVNGVLRLDNSSNSGSQVFWVEIDGAHRVLLDRIALLNLGDWLKRHRSPASKRSFRVSIVSP
jgi:hypothetical protein